VHFGVNRAGAGVAVEVYVFKFAENLFETLFQGQGSAPAGGGRVGQPPPRKADAAAAPGTAQPGLIGPPVDLFGVVDAPEAQPA